MPKSLADSFFSLTFRILRAAAGLLPLRPTLAFCEAVGRWVGPKFARETHIGLTQIAFVKAYLDSCAHTGERDRDVGHTPPIELPAPHRSMSDCEPQQLLSDVFGHIGRAFGEAVLVEKFTKPLNKKPGDPLIERGQALAHVTSTGQERVYEILDNGKSIVALSGHMGCFELLAAYHVRVGVPLSVVARLPNLPVLERLVRVVRGSYGVEVMWRDDPTSPRKFMQAVKGGRVIAALMDQDTHLESGYTPFFGLDAAIPLVLIKLAIRYKMPIFTSFIFRTGVLEHHVVSEEIAYDPADPDAVQKILKTFNARLEELICRYPDQWLWWHRRWRRRPGNNYNASPETLPSSAGYVQWLKDLTDSIGAGRPCAEMVRGEQSSR